MKRNALKTVIALALSTIMLSGCSLSLSTETVDENAEELKQLRAMGVVSYEESTRGIPMDSKDITKKLTDGCYYIKHGDVLYPCYTDISTYTDVMDYRPYPDKRYDVFTSESIVDVPTLFEGDSLLYYNTTGVLMYSTFERFKDLGWSIGLLNIRSTPAGYVYLDMEHESDYPCIMKTMEDVRSMFESDIFIDKIGGVKITSDFCENGIVNGLIEGVNYDIELYDGTNYKYYSATCNTHYFQSYELYFIDKYKPLQDYLYEIEVPEYLLNGYYNIDGRGMFRYVKGTEYDDNTDFNERLLYQYELHEEGDMSKDTQNIPAAYSENNELNKFRAYDEGYFGWEQTRTKTREELEEEENAAKEEEMSPIGLANFLAASRTTTDLWIPDGRPYKITLESDESTGAISLIFSNGRAVKLPYDRIAKTYSFEGTGNGKIATLEVKGLFKNYNISLINAESYHGQDKEVATEEAKEE